MKNKIEYFLYAFYILEKKQNTILNIDNGYAGIYPPWSLGDFVKPIKKYN